MAYDAKRQDIIGTLGFFVLGLLMGGMAAMIAVWREYRQYKKSGVLEYNDVWRYVIVSSIGAVIQLIIILCILFAVL